MDSSGRNITADSQQGLGALYLALWRFAEGKRRALLISCLMLILAQIAKLAIPWLAAQAINTIQTGGEQGVSNAAWLMLAIFGTAAASWLMHGPGRVMERNVAVKVRQAVSDALYQKVSNLPMSWHEAHHSGDTIHRVTTASSALFNFAQSQFIYLQNAVNIIGPIVALFLLSPLTAAAALVGFGLVFWWIVRSDAVMMRLAAAENQAARRYQSVLMDCLGNISTVITLRLQGPTRQMLAARLNEIFAPLKRSILVSEVKWAGVDMMNNALWCALIVLYALMAIRGGSGLKLGNVFMVYQYALQAAGVITTIASNYQEFMRFQTDYHSSADIWAAPGREAFAAVPRDWRRIGARDLCFTYRSRGPRGASLQNVSIDLARGDRIALIGESGSGKSTLMRVLAGLYQAEQGRFIADGGELAGVGDLGGISTLIPQEPEIFENSVLRNITMDLEYASADIERAIDLALLRPVLDALPQGIDTDISEGGLNLSGGQKQRLALARGILAARRSSLIMLDEPTSALDPATEAQLYDNFLAEFPDACLISSVHRLHLLPRFSRVVLMESGRILDMGSIEELFARQPKFQQLWKKYGA